MYILLSISLAILFGNEQSTIGVVVAFKTFVSRSDTFIVEPKSVASFQRITYLKHSILHYINRQLYSDPMTPTSSIVDDATRSNRGMIVWS